MQIKDPYPEKRRDMLFNGVGKPFLGLREGIHVAGFLGPVGALSLSGWGQGGGAAGLLIFRASLGSLVRGPSVSTLCHGVSVPHLAAGFAGSHLRGRRERAEAPGGRDASSRRQLSRVLGDLSAAVLGALKPQVYHRAAGGLSVAQLQQQLPPAVELQPQHSAAAGQVPQWAPLGILPAAGCKGLELRRALLRHLRRRNAVGRGQDQHLQ